MIPEGFNLEGKVAIVTGDGGRGKVLAQALAEAGADVVCAASTIEAAEEVAAAVRGLGRRGMAVAVDITDSQQVDQMVERAVAEMGQVDILVNNAEVEFAKPLTEVSDDEWRKVLDTNLTAAFLCTRAVAGHMLPRGKGRIINIASGLATRGLPNSAAYCASKGGMLQLTRALALEWAKTHIRVNAIGPGWMQSGDVSGEATKDPLLRHIPLGRRGRPEELGALLVYLASDASDYITGQIFFVDGGATSHA